MHHFLYTERDLGYSTDNLIDYNAGPVNFSISTWSEQITVTVTSSEWNFFLKELKPVLMEAWALRDSDFISETDSKFVIGVNYSNLCLYLAHNIIYVDLTDYKK